MGKDSKKKIKLNRETIRNVAPPELDGVAGGLFDTQLFCSAFPRICTRGPTATCTAPPC